MSLPTFQHLDVPAELLSCSEADQISQKERCKFAEELNETIKQKNDFDLEIIEPTNFKVGDIVKTLFNTQQQVRDNGMITKIGSLQSGVRAEIVAIDDDQDIAQIRYIEHGTEKTGWIYLFRTKNPPVLTVEKVGEREKSVEEKEMEARLRKKINSLPEGEHRSVLEILLTNLGAKSFSSLEIRNKKIESFHIKQIHGKQAIRQIIFTLLPQKPKTTNNLSGIKINEIEYKNGTGITVLGVDKLNRDRDKFIKQFPNLKILYIGGAQFYF